MQVQIAGLPWFERDDYESFRPLLLDRQWHPTFDKWERAAQQTFDRLKRNGITPIKAKVRSHDFVAWCNATGRHVDTQALIDFGNEAAARVFMEQQIN